MGLKHDYKCPAHGFFVSREPVCPHGCTDVQPVFLQAPGMISDHTKVSGKTVRQLAIARPVVHEVRCTYPQCQATNGCVGACSKGQAEKQEPVAVKHMMDWVYQLKRLSNDGRYMNIPSGLSAGACYELAVEIEQFIKTAPVHAIDMSEKHVHESDKDRHEFEEMVKRGTKAWADTPDDWVDDLRGGAEAEKQDPDDDIYDVWVEQGTSQENRQVAMRRTTRDEKIVNPGVYEVPVFDCPRYGHCCPEREWVGLTDEEILKLWGSYFPRAMEFYQAIEVKLKEKNI